MPGRRWVVLVTGLFAVATGCAVQYGTPFLIPALRAEGMTLTQAGALTGCPIAGLLATLYAWGAVADRWGERVVMAAGLSLGAAVLFTGTAAHRPAELAATFLVAGAATAAVHAASGRLVLGWFAAHERGRAMAVRQTAQPLGVAAAALALPPLVSAGLATAIAALGAACLIATMLVLALVRDPRRPPAVVGPAAASPYRTATLWRIHGASALLVVPQFVSSTYALVYLVDAQGWAAVPAGRLIAVAQVSGAATRLAVGYWSDRAGSRLRPMRRLAAGIGAVLLVLALATMSDSAGLAITALVAASILAVSTNGLSFTAVAERAGSAWAGRALGVQNTAQNVVAAATPPGFALLIGALSYGGAFVTSVAFPLVACLLIPVGSEARRSRAEV